MKIYSVSIARSKDCVLVFNGVPDSRYTFPVWSQMSRNHRIFFKDGASELTFSDRRGHLEVMAQAATHRESLEVVGGAQ